MSRANRRDVLRTVKDTFKRSRRVLVAYHLYDNWRTKRRFGAGHFELESGATHQRMDLDQSVSYVEQVFQDYLRYGTLTPKHLENKRILEIGPGDNLGVALKFLAAGAQHVIALDRFFAPRDPVHEARIYVALRDRLRGKERARFDGALRLDGDGPHVDERRLRVIHGVGIEDALNLLPPGSVDLIVSRAVLEHLYDADAAFTAMDALLAPGGRLLHKIDFRDHGMFSEYGFHPLEFLTVPEGTYRRMTRDSGKPNRRLLPYYSKKLQALGYEPRTVVTHLVGRAEEYVPHLHAIPAGGRDRGQAEALVRQIRPRLDREFRPLSDEDLMVQGIFVAATRRRERHAGSRRDA